MPSATLHTVVERILDDLFRTDLTAQATTALQGAIRHYDSYPWWFTQEIGTIVTVADQQYYDLPDDFGALASITITRDRTTYPLRSRTQEQLDAFTDIDHTGQPVDYAIFDERLRLWPIPDDVYTATLSYRIRLPEISEGEANAWTNVAEELIRRRAEADVAYSVLRDAEAYQIFKVMEQDALSALRRENMARVATGYTRRKR